MDRGDLESARRLLRAVTRLHQLLCHADGGAVAGDGHGEICRHHAQVGQAPCLDRAREHRQEGAHRAARLEEAAAHLRQFNVRSV